MCARFEIKSSAFTGLHPDLIKMLDQLQQVEYFPSQRIPVLDSPGHFRQSEWGLRPQWGKELLINARTETLLEKETFKPLLNHPCAIPATAYYEWRSEGKQKIKHRIYLPGSECFFMAGLMTEEGRFVILTKAAEEVIDLIHHRMPVILESSGLMNWLTPEWGRRMVLLDAAKNGTYRVNPQFSVLPREEKKDSSQMTLF